MCGFAGEFVYPPSPGRTPRPADLPAVRAMAAALAHRGPDEHTEWVSPDRRCAIGFHRLAVIDPPGSHQPMTSPDGTVTVAFNGEIYNYLDLRAELAAAGASFRTQGDTEVLLHLYERRGVDLVDRLRGMFAFAIYDSCREALLLARDRLGQKPLWYYDLGDRLLFASEAGALLRHPGVPRNIDHTSACFYMSLGYVPAPRTIWRAVRKLPPASVLTVGTTPGTPRRYWSPSPLPAPEDPAECCARLRAALADAVHARLRADVPVGILLSGGIDSAALASILAEAGSTVDAFTAGFPGAGFYDETAAASLTASRLGLRHRVIPIAQPPPDFLDRLVAMFGEPFADSSALPTWLVCAAARKHVTVALAGDGGDEVFGGYDRYRAMHLAQRLSPAGYLAVRLAAFFARLVAPLDERSPLRRFVRFADGLGCPPAEQYFRYRRLFAPNDLCRLFSADFVADLEPEGVAEWFWALYEDFEGARDEVERAQRHDLATYLPDDLLVKADIASMNVGLELRAPFLDPEVVCLGLGIPASLKIRRGRAKWILRETFRRDLPAEILRAPKRGFGVPLGRWLREDLFETLRETLNDPWLGRQGILRPEAIAGLLNDHFSGRADHRHRLWALLIFARWLRFHPGR